MAANTTVQMHEAVEELRPQRADAQRNRQRVLDAAFAVFAEQGAEAQMEEIARRAGVGVGTVYRHFATKDALIEGLVRVRFEEMLERVRAAAERHDTWEAIAEQFRAAAEMHARDRIFAEISDSPRDIPSLAPLLDEMLRCWQTLIARAHAQGTVVAEFDAADIPSLMCGLSSVVLNARSEADWRRYLEIMLAGLRAAPAAALAAPRS